ncbi:unnamed protein product [Orchesella dallaii]|uniref:Peptidase S1 domain-containing protein n=1 Tax=Orchesella dallaii TaxID=48710 RepID=A0ABP1S9V9_9HEXA
MRGAYYFLVLGVSITVGAVSVPNVIGNNTKAAAEDAPWIVSLQMEQDDFAFCGATLINSNCREDKNCSGWVITAASCLEGIPRDSLIATLGNLDLSDPSVGIPLNINRSSFTVHENYNASSHENDVGLFKVDFDCNSDEATTCGNFSLNIKSQFNITEDLYDKINASFAGWGLLVEKGPLQKVLYNTSIPLRTDKNCTSLYDHEVFKGDSMICAGAAGFGPCSHDTGGPLACQYEENEKFDKWLCGIASFGDGCGNGNKPAVFTDITNKNFIEWVEKKITETDESVNVRRF